MKNTLLIIALLISFYSGSSGQELSLKEAYNNVRPNKGIHVNIYGNGSVFSLNYEGYLSNNSNAFLAMGVGIGMGIEAIGRFTHRHITLPHHFTGNLGKDAHFLEYGLGGTLVFGDVGQNYLLYPIIGYRLLPPRYKTICFRIYITYPFSGLPVEDLTFIPIGVSVGVGF